MDTTLDLPLPSLSKGRFATCAAWTDEFLYDASGVRIAFTERTGGSSTGPFESLNLGFGADDASVVDRNRSILFHAVLQQPIACISPVQVHGSDIVVVDSSDSSTLDEAAGRAKQGADAVVVDTAQVAALLCYADCVPLIMVAPGGAFVVAHAGWRGTVSHIASKALRMLVRLSKNRYEQVVEKNVNIYIGPYIHSECFEVGSDVARLFKNAFGRSVVVDGSHVDLGAAVCEDMVATGASQIRITDVDRCTSCNQDAFFSYRGSNGVCGRHAATAVRTVARGEGVR